MDNENNNTSNAKNVNIEIVKQSNPDYLCIGYKWPTGDLYLVCPENLDNTEITKFIQKHIDQAVHIQEMIKKRNKKKSSNRCRYESGDLVYFLGRPFIIRVNPIKNPKPLKVGACGRADLKVNFDNECSLITLQVLKTGSFDQRRQAFMAYAGVVFKNNIENFLVKITKALEEALKNCEFVLPDYRDVMVRPMRNKMVSVQNETKKINVSEQLIPFPAFCIVYEIAKSLIDDVFLDFPQIEVEKEELLLKLCPRAKDARAVLADTNSPFRQQ